MREVIATEQAPQAIGPYSQAIRAQAYLYLGTNRHRSCHRSRSSPGM